MQDYNEFSRWFLKDFINRNSGLYPTNIERWFNKVNRCHDRVRTLLGSDKTDKHYKIQSEQQHCDLSEIEDVVDTIVSIIPNYLNDHRFNKDVFRYPYLSSGTHNIVKLSKHISQYIVRHGLSSDQTRQIQTALAELGKRWAASKSQDIEATVTISTTPKAFALLGHYGPDKDSCFRQNSDHPYDKYIFGQSSNTCVITVSKNIAGKARNVARVLGIVDANYNLVSLANCYFNSHIKEGDIIALLKNAFSDLFESKVILLYNRVQFPDELVYHNPYGNWTIADASLTSEQIRQTGLIYFNASFINHFDCEHCGERFDPEPHTTITEIDGKYCCSYCSKNANECELTGKLTFSGLTEIIGPDDIEIMVHPKELAGLATCEETGMKTVNVVEVDGVNMSRMAFEDLYTTCDFCKATIPEECIYTDVDGFEMCEDCYEQLGGNEIVDEEIEAVN